jgi:hypothetical protein
MEFTQVCRSRDIKEALRQLSLATSRRKLAIVIGQTGFLQCCAWIRQFHPALLPHIARGALFAHQFHVAVYLARHLLLKKPLFAIIRRRCRDLVLLKWLIDGCYLVIAKSATLGDTCL